MNFSGSESRRIDALTSVMENDLLVCESAVEWRAWLEQGLGFRRSRRSG